MISFKELKLAAVKQNLLKKTAKEAAEKNTLQERIEAYQAFWRKLA